MDYEADQEGLEHNGQKSKLIAAKNKITNRGSPKKNYNSYINSNTKRKVQNEEQDEKNPPLRKKYFNNKKPLAANSAAKGSPVAKGSSIVENSLMAGEEKSSEALVMREKKEERNYDDLESDDIGDQLVYIDQPLGKRSPKNSSEVLAKTVRVNKTNPLTPAKKPVYINEESEEFQKLSP